MHAGGPKLVAVWMVLLLLPACSGLAGDEQPSRSDRMSAAVERAVAANTMFDAVQVVVVVADGKTLVEHYSGVSPEEYQPVQSVTRSVISTLVGIAVDDGLLALDDTLAQLLPRYADQMTPEVASVTLRDLLTMRGGFIEEADPGGLDFSTAPDAVAAALATGAGAQDTFGYSSAGAHLVAAVLAEATGMSVLDYGRRVLFQPLGIDTQPAAEPLAVRKNIAEYLAADFAWPVDRQGINLGWSLLKLRPTDLLALGQLVLDDGRWHSDQVVPATWVADATSPQVKVDDRFSYGYLWWRTSLAGRDAAAALGAGGQSVIIVPDLDLVAVTVGKLHRSSTRDISPMSMMTLVESAIAVGYGRR
jgi:CubicO group peptidase (beta-lactamase class C family)